MLASGDIVAFVDVSDTTQSAQGSLVKGTLTQFFAAIPVPVVVTSATAAALAVGRLGATTPAFTVDASTASQVAGLKVTGAVTGGTVAVVTTDSGSNTNLTINAKGSGTIGIGSVSTGRVTITPVVTITGALTQTGLATFNAGLVVAAGQKIGVGGAATYAVHVVDGGFVGTVGFGATSTTDGDNWFYGTGTIASGSAFFLNGTISASDHVNAHIVNGNASTGNTRIRAQVEVGTTGDAYSSWIIRTSTEWTAGPDTSDSGTFKIGPNANPSTGTASIAITTGHAVAFAGTVGIGGAAVAHFQVRMTGSVTAATGIGRAINIGTTLVAAANSDVLTTCNVSSSITPGAFTGLALRGLSVAGVTTAACTSPADPIGIDVQAVTGTGATNAYGIRISPPGSASNNYLIAAQSVGVFNVLVDGTGTFGGPLAITGALTGATTGAFSGLVTAAAFKTGSGTTTVANGATTTLFAATASGSYYVTVTVAGSTTHFASALFLFNGTAVVVVAGFNVVSTTGATLGCSGTNIQLTNGDASSHDYDWRYLRVAAS